MQLASGTTEARAGLKATGQMATAVHTTRIASHEAPMTHKPRHANAQLTRGSYTLLDPLERRRKLRRSERYQDLVQTRRTNSKRAKRLQFLSISDKVLDPPLQHRLVEPTWQHANTIMHHVSHWCPKAPGQSSKRVCGGTIQSMRAATAQMRPEAAFALPWTLGMAERTPC